MDPAGSDAGPGPVASDEEDPALARLLARRFTSIILTAEPELERSSSVFAKQSAAFVAKLGRFARSTARNQAV